ncbi:MAG: helicase-related protein [Candidatus Methanomethylophilaceae archaeon]|nr:helicase-related protein [Candidatus Methanomethylophilaceae archaeon]
MAFWNHPLVEEGKVEERSYQIALANACLNESTLVVLPTGMGKTIVALMVIAEVLQRQGGKVLLMAPTKPLVDQHRRTLETCLKDSPVSLLDGSVDPVKRSALWDAARVIVSTPQCVANDLENGRVSLDEVNLVIYDEAHRGVGSYAYVKVAEAYRTLNRLSMGITASPGSDASRIQEVCENMDLFRIEVRTERDPDVLPYVHDISVKVVEVDMPEDLCLLISLLRKMLERCLEELTSLRLMDPHRPPSVKHLLQVGRSLQSRLAAGEKSPVIFRGLSLQAMAVKLNHAVGLAETQGTSSLRQFFDKLEKDATGKKSSRAAVEIVAQEEYRKCLDVLDRTRVEHPKISRVMSLTSCLINSRPGSKVLVFAHYRDTCELVAQWLEKIEGAKVGLLVGQSGEHGLKQKEQIEVLNRFRDGSYNVVVATSVGEEGLDVVSTDMVIFYEPVPSEIRTIQRRGRTGRSDAGEVYVLIAKGTRDVAYQSSSDSKEELMKKRLLNLNHSLRNRAIHTREANQRSLLDFPGVKR